QAQPPHEFWLARAEPELVRRPIVRSEAQCRHTGPPRIRSPVFRRKNRFAAQLNIIVTAGYDQPSTRVRPHFPSLIMQKARRDFGSRATLPAVQLITVSVERAPSKTLRPPLVQRRRNGGEAVFEISGLASFN